nr:nucleotide-binding alpha-beta plait domain-containing protein [Tanacetum cinerariifolium]
VLQISILEACDQSLFKGISLSGDGANISLLQYVDNALIFGEWSLENEKNLINVLKCYNEASGLGVNLAKNYTYGLGLTRLRSENDIFSFFGMIRLGTFQLKKSTNFVESRKIGMIWSLGLLEECKRCKILFVCKDGLTIPLVDGDVEKVGDLSLESIEDEEVATVDGVFEGAFGTLGDKT